MHMNTSTLRTLLTNKTVVEVRDYVTTDESGVHALSGYTLVFSDGTWQSVYRDWETGETMVAVGQGDTTIIGELLA